MISTGNDIVSLERINIDRTNEYRFYSKILCAAEQELFDFKQLQIPFEHFVWLLWSVKESAYKYFKRLDAHVNFSPLKFVVTEIHFDKLNEHATNRFFSGGTTFQQRELFYSTEYNDNFVHTIIHHSIHFDTVFTGYTTLQSDKYEHQSLAAKHLLQKDFSQHFNQLIQIKKNEAGCPEIIFDKKKFSIPVSISHDGFFVGYSCVVR